MELFWKAAAAALLTAILGVALGKQDKQMSLLLSLAGCILIAGLGEVYLEPVVGFLEELVKLGDLRGDMLGILLKAVGIGLICEITAVVCHDSGNDSLGKLLQIIGSAAILWLSIPVFRALLELIQSILGEV